jgi:hypothetical protein
MAPPEHDGASSPVAGEESLDTFVDLQELGRRLGVHARTVRRMVDRGELPQPCLGAEGKPRWLWSYVLDHCRRRHRQSDKTDRRLRSKLR